MAEPYIGEIRLFAGTFAPENWAICNGSLMPISQNPALFTLIGTTYGGDGVVTFGLPNLLGRIPLHTGTGFQLGQMAGVETVTLPTNQMPVHTHPAQGQSASGNQAGPANGLWAASSLAQYSANPPSGVLNPASLAQSGGSQPHENMMPFQAVTYIIALFGVFPSQN